jgi:hypothetical protein
VELTTPLALAGQFVVEDIQASNDDQGLFISIATGADKPTSGRYPTPRHEADQSRRQ